MNTNQNTPAADLDQLLSSFFKAELPDPFPPLRSPAASRAEMPMPASDERASRSRQTISKSRLSLAVSAALLLGGCWYLSGHMGKAPARTAIGKSNDSAHLQGALEKANKDLKKANNSP